MSRNAQAELKDEVAQVLKSVVGAGEVKSFKNVGGSAWASCIKCDTEDGQSFFVKASSEGPEMFEGEGWSLRALHHASQGTSMRIPAVYYSGATSTGSMIVMDFLNFGGRADQYELGKALAQMHLAEPLAEEAKKGQFGFPVNNTLGPTHQPNPWTNTWVDFLREHRLRYIVQKAKDTKLEQKVEQLCQKLDSFFDGIDIKPSVLHGDLWAGNVAAVDGKPSIYDPATFYGHSEYEFGMSWCASFGSSFWQGYRELMPQVWPTPSCLSVVPLHECGNTPFFCRLGDCRSLDSKIGTASTRYGFSLCWKTFGNGIEVD